MRLFKKFLRFWITLTTAGGFLASWALLAHAAKPVQPAGSLESVTAAIPTLAPLPPLDLPGDFASGDFQQPQFTLQQSPSFFWQGRGFRTGGS